MQDLQAQDRAHRIGQRKNVRVFRIITQSPVEEKILSRATEKLQMNELVVEAGKFDKSGQDKDDNSLERLKMMELLLQDFDQNQNAQSAAASEEDFEKDTDDGEEEESKDLLNELISSNDDDYKLYCEMDRDRTDAPALFTAVSDCPDWILYPNGKPEPGAEIVDPDVFGKRRAAAGEKIYDDGLTEKQFCRMMDKHADEDDKGKKKRKKKRNRNAVDPSLILDYDGSGGRKRSKTTHLQLDDATPRSKASSSSNGGLGNGDITAAMYDRLLSVTRSIIYLKEKGTKRKLSDIFLEKPCPQTYPDYYQLIEKPIGMNDILRKCRAKLYSSGKEFREDWNTLFKNALTYNGEGSWIVNDAEFIRGELDRLMEKNDLNNVDTVKVLKASSSAAPPKKPVRIKLSLKIPKKKKDTQEENRESGASTPAPMKLSESQSELSNRFDSEEDSESSDSDSDGDSDND
jgi:ATP-dependent helicase STH1/SNF2